MKSNWGAAVSEGKFGAAVSEGKLGATEVRKRVREQLSGKVATVNLAPFGSVSPFIQPTASRPPADSKPTDKLPPAYRQPTAHKVSTS